MDNTEAVKHKAVRSVKWSVLIELVSRTIQPIIFLVLTRLLTPNDFGLASAATIVINFSQMFWDAGLSKALIQTKEDVASAANVVFWLNGLLGVTIYAVLFTCAPLIAQFFNSPGFVPVLRVVAVQVIIQSLSAVQQTLLMRDMDFKRLFGIKLATAFVPGLFSIPMAMAGLGVWALVAGTLVGSTTNLLWLWNKSAWRPKWSINFPLLKRLSSFGSWVVGESSVAWFMNWGDNLMVGHFLGMQSLGIYAVAWNICNLIYGLLLSPFSALMYPSFSRLQDDRQALKAAFHRVNEIMISLSLPIGVGFLLVAPEFAEIFFGDKWHGLGLVLSLIGFLLGISSIMSITPEVLRSIGRPDINTKLKIVFILFYFPAFLIAAQFNLIVFSYVRLGVSLIPIPFNIFTLVYFLGVSPFYLRRDGRSTMLSVLFMASGVMLTQWLFTFFMTQTPLILKLIVEIILGGSIYFLMLWSFDRKFIIQNIKLAKQVIL